MTPFFANHGFHPCTGIKSPEIYKREQQIELLVADKIIYRQKEIMAFLQDQLAWPQNKQTQFANKTCQPHPEYKVRDKVYVDVRHFASKRDKKLLNLKKAGSWRIVWNIDNKVYKLNIPKTLKNTGLIPIFHLWKIHLASNNSFPGQILLFGLSIKISGKNNDNKAHKEWEVLKIVNYCQTK